MKNILFVCTGNTCRSSMAEAFLRDLLYKEGLAGEYFVRSAGTGAFPGMPASHNAVQAMGVLGIDLSQHCSGAISDDLVDNADLILTMTASQKNILLQLRPDAVFKIYTLTEYCNAENKTDISDPFGGNLDMYVKCRDDIIKYLYVLVRKLKEKGEL